MEISHVPQENNQTVTPNLPDEIIHYDILTRLPVKSLVRFKSVCKYWYALIKYSSSFINIHQKYALESHDSGDFMIVFADYTYFRAYAYYCAPQSTGETADVSLIDLVDNDYPKTVVGSCNGLICLKLRQGELMLYNPVTREYRTFIEPATSQARHYMTFDNRYGFGYDIVSKNYKLVKIIEDAMCSIDNVQVYSTDRKSWTKPVNFPPFDMLYNEFGIVINNTLHWTASEWLLIQEIKRSIVTFDLHTEEFGEMIFPSRFYSSHYSNKLTVANGRLCTITSNNNSNRPFSNLEIWMMKVYGVSESWTKLYEILDGEIPTKEISIIAFRRTRKEGDEEALIRKYVDDEKYELVWYNLENKSIRKVGVVRKKYWTLIKREWPCIASLAPIPG